MLQVHLPYGVCQVSLSHFAEKLYPAATTVPFRSRLTDNETLLRSRVPISPRHKYLKSNDLRRRRSLRLGLDQARTVDLSRSVTQIALSSKRRPSCRHEASIDPHPQPRFGFSRRRGSVAWKWPLSLSTRVLENLTSAASSAALSPEATDSSTRRFTSDFH